MFKRKKNKEMTIGEAVAELIILATRVDSLTNLSIPAPDVETLEKLSIDICAFEKRLPKNKEYDSVMLDITQRLDAYIELVGQLRIRAFETMVGGFW